MKRIIQPNSFKTLILIIALTNSLNSIAQENKYNVVGVGFYNLENLFDTIDTPEVFDSEFTPKGKKHYDSNIYHDKLENLSTVIKDLGVDLSPDGLAILGVSEIENKSVLQDLVSHENIRSRNYQIIHNDSPDKRGIDVGLLYQPKYFEPTQVDNIPLLIYKDNGDRKYTRDILHVSGDMLGERWHILVNHWPSRSGGEKVSALARNAAATLCKTLLDSLQTLDPTSKVIIMGDLNDNPTNTSVKKILKAQKDKEFISQNTLYNPYMQLYRKGFGSNAWRDTWSLFDQIMVSSGLVLADPNSEFSYYRATIFNQDYLITKSGKYKGYPLRTFSGDMYNNGYSDHFPVFVTFVKRQQ